MSSFKLVSDYQPQGDQPAAIDALCAGLQEGKEHQVLLGVTGSGKTFTMANIIARLDRPALIMSHNKTLAAQLYREFKAFFPENAVEYFVSYYDYYQPEAYVPASDVFIEKEAHVNDEIDRLRHSATVSVLERRDVIIVASVSCIYGIGDVVQYKGMLLALKTGMKISREQVMTRLSDMQYSRNEMDFHRGTFRVKGDVLEVYPSNYEQRAVRVEFFGDEIERLVEIDPLRGTVIQGLHRGFDSAVIYPQSHYAVSEQRRKDAITAIRAEAEERLEELAASDKLLAAERLRQRTSYDLEMLEHVGFCNGIENYSRHLTGRSEGEPPFTLLDYFPEDFLCFVDESHVTLPQVGGMYRGDRARKTTLVDYGFRLPSALDNRPLMFDEFEERIGQRIYVSATPGPLEMEHTGGQVVEQIIRPTGLTDPPIEIRAVGNQVDDLYGELRGLVERGERALVTTLTKRMAEELTEYYDELGLRVRYMHADIETLERTRLIYDLRRGVYDVLIGINLLREGLDIPEVSLVAILDADKEGFLRSERSLIQVSGRAARHLEGRVIMYADRVTGSMARAIAETNRRREVQERYNETHGIKPQGIERPVTPMIEHDDDGSDARTGGGSKRQERRRERLLQEISSLEALETEIFKIEKEMKAAAEALDFEQAISLRERLHDLRALHLSHK